MKTAKGSVTVFFSLMMFVCLAFAFVLLESARAQGIYDLAQQRKITASETVAAEYHRELWNGYGIMAVDASYLTDTFSKEKVEERTMKYAKVQREQSILSVRQTDATLEQYQLLTDGEGAVFYNIVAAQMKEQLPYDLLERVSNLLSGDQQADTDTQELWEEALSSLEQAKTETSQKEDTEDSSDVAEALPEVTLDVDDPVTYVEQLKKRDILSIVATDVSDRAVTLSELYSQRDDKEEGTMSVQADYSGLEAKVLFAEYAIDTIGDYRTPNTNGGLAYGVEYVIAGKRSDRENLKKVVHELLLIREAVNYAYLLTDVQKQEEALAVSTMLVGFTGNPLIVKAVQQGILLAWSYVESITELRTLLSGGKIAYVKTSAEWTTSLERLRHTVESSKESSKDGTGMSYESALRMLLYTKKQKQMCERTIDMIEAAIRKTEDNAAFCMDHCMSAFQWKFTYVAEPLFLRGLQKDGSWQIDGYTFETETAYSYLE
jgi:hypothetical protein